MNDRGNETGIREALSRLREATHVPPPDPDRERALLAAFDQYWSKPRPRPVSWSWTVAAAALLGLTAGLNWMVLTEAPRSLPASSNVRDDVSGFVPWPGSEAWPRFESGALMRVELPASSLPLLGLVAPASAGSVVQADLLVGQDGFARAVRLVREP